MTYLDAEGRDPEFDADYDASTAGGSGSSSPSNSVLDGLFNNLGSILGGVGSIVKGTQTTKPVTTKPTLSNTNTWTPYLFIGGGLVLLLVLVFAFKRK